MSKRTTLTPSQASRRPAPIDAALTPDLFKALCDPTRARLLACLAKCGRACSVGEVADCCSVDFSVVSRHLALLARADVVSAVKRGRAVLYQVQYASLSRSLRRLADAIDECCPPGAVTGSDRCCAPPRAKPPRGTPS